MNGLRSCGGCLNQWLCTQMGKGGLPIGPAGAGRGPDPETGYPPRSRYLLRSARQRARETHRRRTVALSALGLAPLRSRVACAGAVDSLRPGCGWEAGTAAPLDGPGQRAARRCSERIFQVSYPRFIMFPTHTATDAFSNRNIRNALNEIMMAYR